MMSIFNKLFILFFAVSITGCLEPTANVDIAAIKKNLKKAKKQSPVDDDDSFEAKIVDYTASGKRDPFTPFISPVVDSDRPEFKRKLTPLQKYDLQQLTLVGIVYGVPNPKALIETPDRKGFIIERGTALAKNCRVKLINEFEVLLKQDVTMEDEENICTKLKLHKTKKEFLSQQEK